MRFFVISQKRFNLMILGRLMKGGIIK